MTHFTNTRDVRNGAFLAFSDEAVVSREPVFQPLKL